MHISKLSLVNYRNFPNTKLLFQKGINTVIGENGTATVSVERIEQSKTAPVKRNDPAHPLADKDGNVWEAAVDSAAELVEMIETSRQYQNNVQVLQTAKGLITETLRLGQ